MKNMSELSPEELAKEVEWIETAIQDPNSVEHRIYLSNAPRRDLITRWAQDLEKLHDAGLYQNNVNTISGHIQQKFKKMGNAQCSSLCP